MVTVSYPGVYVEEVPSAVHTITGVSTSIATFFGRAVTGPMDKAIRIQNLSEYLHHFGNPLPQSLLAESVRLFFANGGADCYVIRLAHDANQARVTLGSIRSNNVLVATAKNKGILGNQIRIEVNYNTSNPDDTFNMVVIQEKEGKIADSKTFPRLSMNPSSARFAPTFVTQESELIDLALHDDMCDPEDCDALNSSSYINDSSNSFVGFSEGRRPISLTILQDLIDDDSDSFQINVNDTRPVAVILTDWVVPEDTADISDQLEERINNALRVLSPQQAVSCSIDEVSNVGNLIRITAATTDGENSSVRITRAPTDDIAAALMLGVDQGGIEPVRWSNFRPAPTAAYITLGSVDSSGSLSTNSEHLQDVNAIARLEQTAFDLTIVGNETYTIELVEDNIVTVPGVSSRWYQSTEVSDSVHGGNDGVREKLRIIATAINNNLEVPYRAEVWGYHLAILANEGSHNHQPTIAVSTSLSLTIGGVLIENVRQYTLGSSGTSEYSNATPSDDDGSDGVAPQISDYLGNPNEQTGFHALDPVDLFNLMVIPDDQEFDDSNTLERLWGPASNYCKQNRAFLLIDPPKNWSRNGRPTVKQETDLIGDLKRNLGDARDHAAVFYPRLEYMDSMGLARTIGPACIIAGLISRIDSSRGVWKAPAGIEASLNNVMGLDVNLTDPENGVLNKLAVNCIRKYPNGFVNWGARTMDGDDDTGSEWKYIPIRRLALFIEESLYRGTKWVVFEPNDEPLWAKIRLNVGVFMTGLYRQGAFQGTSPNKAFFVKCDAETTTQADRNLGIVNIVVGFAPLKPAEFVIVKIQQIVGDLV